MKTIANEDFDLIKASKAAKQLKASLNSNCSKINSKHSYSHSHYTLFSPQKYIESRNQRRRQQIISSDKKQYLNDSLKMLEICFKDLRQIRDPETKSRDKMLKKSINKDVFEQVTNYRNHQKYFSQGYIQNCQQNNAKQDQSIEIKRKERFKRYKKGMDNSEVQRIIAKGVSESEKDDKNNDYFRQLNSQKLNTKLSEAQLKRHLKDIYEGSACRPPLPLNLKNNKGKFANHKGKQLQKMPNQPNQRVVIGVDSSACKRGINKIKKIILTPSHQSNLLVDKQKSQETKNCNLQSSDKQGNMSFPLQSSFQFLQEKFKEVNPLSVQKRQKSIKEQSRTKLNYYSNQSEAAPITDCNMKLNHESVYIGSSKNLRRVSSKQKQVSKKSVEMPKSQAISLNYFDSTARFAENDRKFNNFYGRTVQSLQRKSSLSQKKRQEKSKSSQSIANKNFLNNNQGVQNNNKKSGKVYSDNLEKIPQCPRQRQRQRLLKVKLPSKSHFFTKSYAGKVNNNGQFWQNDNRNFKQADLVKKCERCLKSIVNSPKIKMESKDSHRIVNSQIQKEGKKRQKGKQTVQISRNIVQLSLFKSKQNFDSKKEEINYQLLMPVVNKELKPEQQRFSQNILNLTPHQRNVNIADQVKKTSKIASVESAFYKILNIDSFGKEDIEYRKRNRFEVMQTQLQNYSKETKNSIHQSQQSGIKTQVQKKYQSHNINYKVNNCNRENSMEIQDIIIKQIESKKKKTFFGF